MQTPQDLNQTQDLDFRTLISVWLMSILLLFIGFLLETQLCSCESNRTSDDDSVGLKMCKAADHKFAFFTSESSSWVSS